MDDKLKQKILEYTVIFEPAEEGGFLVSVPFLPGCITQGDTFEEARINIMDALEGYLEVLQEQGETIPFEEQGAVVTKVMVINPQYKE